jgi:peroxisomal 2,4-dienoyl-CoA reductase
MSAPRIFPPDLLAGKVALITGGGTGVGLGIASCLARAGATVAIASRKPEHLLEAANALSADGAKVTTVETNVREPEAVGRMVERVAGEHGRIDLLVNNAAGNFYAPSATLSPNAWRAVVETDLYGTFYCSQAVHPVMKAQGGGRIVSISMTLHYRGWRTRPPPRPGWTRSPGRWRWSGRVTGSRSTPSHRDRFRPKA